jgi:nucleoside-diphosphate-sugar epimerase
VSRILIAGCGYLGTAIAKLFLREGWSVEGWTRSGSIESEPRSQFDVRAVDLSQSETVRSAPGEFDVVLHSASTRGGEAADYARVYRGGVENLLQRFPRSQLLFVSSTSVYAQRSGQWVDESSPAEPLHERGRILRDTENLVLSHGGRVARLAGIYGPDRSALLRRVLANEASVDEKADRFVNQVHRDDAASALFKISQLADGGGQIWNVADNEPLLLSECYRWLGRKLNRSLSTTRSAGLSRKRGESNKRVSNSRLQTAGWAPTYPSFKEGMKRSVLPAS